VSAQAHSRVLRIGLCFAVLVGTWLGTNWLLAFGLWVFVIGDREASLWFLAPILSIVVGAIVAVFYFRSSATRPWQTFLWFAIATISSVLVGWYIIIFMDEML